MATLAEGQSMPAPVARPGGLYAWLTTVDHKKIGILYLVTSFVFFIAGGLEALVMRIQLAKPENDWISPQAYNELFTMHGTTMIFLVVMPVLLGFGNYLVPLQVGARDMAFARLNALSYWLFLFGGLLLYFSFFAGAVPDVGWFSYAPLSEKPYSTGQGVDYWILGLLVTGFGTIITGVNLVVTVVRLRAPGMTPFRIPVFTWMSLITALIIVGAIPSLTAAQVMLLFDRTLGTAFFDTNRGGDPLLWQHLFWFFGHPEVYIMALPAFGMLSEIIPVFARKPIFGYAFLIGAGVAIAFYSFLVWAHHMFAVGLGVWGDAFFGAASMIIAIPTGIKIFNWLATLWGGRIQFTTAMKFCISFIALFTIGGVSGVQFAMVPVDWQLTDSYYVVAHFHYVLFGGSFMGIMGATYYWFPKMTGRMLSERLGNWNFWTLFFGFNITFFPMHILGLLGMPRRVYTYPDKDWWGPINLLETLGAGLTAVSILILTWNIIASLRHGKIAGDDPWDAWTLEWATTSPPPEHNFPQQPLVNSARPWRDAKEKNWPLFSKTSAAAAKPRRMLATLPVPVLGMITFIASEIVFFGGLIAAFITYRTRGPGPDPTVLDIPVTAVFTIFLLTSSLTFHRAEQRLDQDDIGGFRRWLGATLLLGIIFIAGQIYEYRHLYNDDVKLDTNLFTSAFYTLTGFHGFHVIIGLVLLGILMLLSLRHEISANRQTAVKTIGVYWHFVDAVWIVVFSVVYLWSLAL